MSSNMFNSNAKTYVFILFCLIIFILLFLILSNYLTCFLKIYNSNLKKKQLYNSSSYRWNLYDSNRKCVLGLGTISRKIIQEFENISVIHHNEITELVNFDVLFLTYKVLDIKEEDAINYLNDILCILGDNKKQIVNFCSEAEIIYMPNRYKYGKLKKKINKILNDSIHIVYNIYLPYEKFIDIPNLLLNFDSDYLFHYPGILSQYTRPCYSNTLVCHGNSSIETIEKKYGILLFHPLFLKKWKLYFSGNNKKGKLHYDRQRCFGNTFRVLKTIKNTSNYTILINNKIFTPSKITIL